MISHQVTRRRDFLGLGVAALGYTLFSEGNSRFVQADEVPPEAATTSTWSLGLASYTTRAFDLETTIRFCQRAGLKHLCLKDFHLPLQSSDETCAAAAKKVADAGLDLYGCGVVGMNSEADVDNAFRYARAAGMRIIVASPKNDEAILAKVNAKIVETGIVVAIHNHGPGDKNFPTPESVFEKVEKYDPRFGLCVDIGHTVRYGANLVESLKHCASRIHDFHFKDVTAASAKGSTCICGRGVIDLPEVVRTLFEIGYKGIAAFEYEAEEKDPLPGLCESVGYIRGVSAQHLSNMS